MNEKLNFRNQHERKPQASCAETASRDAEPNQNRKPVIYSCSPEGLVHHWTTEAEMAAAYRKSPQVTNKAESEEEKE